MPANVCIRDCVVADAAELARLRVDFLRKLGQLLPADHGRPIHARLGYVAPPDFMAVRLGQTTGEMT